MSNTLKKITARAKQIYKPGKGSWTDAIKRASVELKRSKKIGATKIIQRGETKRTPAKKVLMQKRSSSGTFKGYSKVSGSVHNQIGAIKKGGSFIYYKGVQIEKMPIEVPGKGKKMKKKYIFIVHSKVHHSIDSAKAAIRSLS